MSYTTFDNTPGRNPFTGTGTIFQNNTATVTQPTTITVDGSTLNVNDAAGWELTGGGRLFLRGTGTVNGGAFTALSGSQIFVQGNGLLNAPVPFSSSTTVSMPVPGYDLVLGNDATVKEGRRAPVTGRW